MVRSEIFLKVPNRIDETAKCGGHVRKVGNATSHNKDLALGMFGLGHETDNRLGIFIRVFGTRCSRVLAIVGQLAAVAEIRNGVGVNDAGPTSGYHGPDATGRIQDGEFQRRSRLGIQFSNIRFFRILLCCVRKVSQKFNNNNNNNNS